MLLKYLPEDRIIVQDDADRPIVTNLSLTNVADLPTDTLGRAMAAAPLLVCVLDSVREIEADKAGDRTLSEEGMEAIYNVLSAFTPDDLLALTHFVYVEL